MENNKIKIYNKTQGKCWYCGKILSLDFNIKNKDYFNIDHQNSKSNKYENLVPACKSCNSSKRNKTLNEFREWASNPYKFTEEQIIYLGSIGIKKDKIIIKNLKFYGEQK